MGTLLFSSLTEGQQLGAFTARAVYHNAGGDAIGARFVHANGMPVDVLLFASVPQVSLYARTLPVSEKGEPHTGEHLLIGKGRIGKYLNSLLSMRLAEHTAGTHTDLTNYQFHTAAGLAGFTELTENYLQALLAPEFTDEEIRREVCNVEAVTGDGGRLHVEEKGTVYTEMVSTMEKPDSVNWDQLGRMLYGPEHPLARNQGGLPAAIRELSVEEVRRFLSANYHLGPNMEMIVALPLGWSPAEVLAHLERIFAKLASPHPPAHYAVLPPYQPFREPEIRIGAYPSDDQSSAQRVLFGWRPLAQLTPRDSTRLSLFLELLGGGETSYLHRDLVDRKTRTLESGVTGVGTYLGSPPMAAPMALVDGLPVNAVEPGMLGRLRAKLGERVAWFVALKPGSPDAAEVARKARSLIASSRRAMLRFMDAPPHFGDRGTGIEWHRHLDQLCTVPGFVKSVSLSEVYDGLEAELARGEVPWAAIARAGGLTDVPCVAAVKPDATLLARERADKTARLAAAERAAAQRTGLADAQQALTKLAEEAAAHTRELDARDRALPAPRFVADPPLALDDVPYRVDPLPPGRGAIRTFFGSTPFTDLRLIFDVTHLSREDLALLPLAATVLSEVGVVVDGRELDYVQAAEAVREEIYALGAGYRGSAVTGRRELALAATASTPAEVDRAADWMGAYLTHRPPLARVRDRLVDVIRRSIASSRNVFEQPEEYWVQSAANAYLYQDQPGYMATASTFTVLRLMTRLRFRLEADGADKDRMRATLAEVAKAALDVPREALAARLAAEHGEMAEFFAYELAHLPPDGWRADLGRLVQETTSDLAAGPAATLAQLSAMLARVLCRRGARVAVTGGEANAARALERLRGLLAQLPEGEPAAPAPAAAPLVLENLRRRGAVQPGEVPVHVALVNASTKSGVHVISAPGPRYADATDEAALDALTAGLYAGAGPQAFFMQTWSAGLAYSNGLRADPASGRLLYYAERCPDLAQTMKFVAGLAHRPLPDDAGLVDASLANAFTDYRGADDFSGRGEALAANLVDGLTPEVVRAFKSRLVATAARPGLLEELRARVPEVVGRVVMGLGPKLSARPGTLAFAIGPEPVLAVHERHLVELGEATRLVRLYPRDFWPAPDR